MTNYDAFPQEPSEDELVLLTAEEYLSALSEGDQAAAEARRDYVNRTDLVHEIDAQVALINELAEDFNTHPDENTDLAIQEAKRDLGHMLVDKGNLPPA